MNSNKKNEVKILNKIILDKRRVVDNSKLYPTLRNTKEGKVYGYINENGIFVIEPIYSSAYNFNNESAIVQEGEKFGLINKKGKYILNPTFDTINEFKENRAIFSQGNSMGVIDENGNTITKKRYDFISNYNEGRAIVGVNSKDGNYKYGYIDLDGNEIIAPIYNEATDFNEGKALVKIDDKKYSLINIYGEIINTYEYSYVSQYGNGLMVFEDPLKGDLGYIDIDGEVAIKAKYKTAEGFKDGVAIVSESDNFLGPYGVIDKEGNYIYKPIFSDIKLLGEDRIALGKSIGNSDINLRSIYAIGDTKGNKLTDFIYLVVGEFKDGLAYVSNEEDTFFIDLSGKEVSNLPRVSGSGELLINNNLIYADIDYMPYYLDKSGKIVYKPNTIINLDNNYSVLMEKYKPNINYLIYTPIVKGVNDKLIEDKINNKLKELSYFTPYSENKNEKSNNIKEIDVLDYNYYGDFNIKYFKNNLLNLELQGYYYKLGAAHGIPLMKTPLINLITGKFYILGDLFKGGVYWSNEINKIIKDMIETDKQYDYVFKDQFKGIKENQDFYIDDSNLYIYFPPYEIGPYSAGFITFKIPFSKIQGLLNKNGEFYKELLS